MKKESLEDLKDIIPGFDGIKNCLEDIIKYTKDIVKAPAKENNKGSCLENELIMGIESVLKKFIDKNPITIEKIERTTILILSSIPLSVESLSVIKLPFLL